MNTGVMGSRTGVWALYIPFSGRFFFANFWNRSSTDFEHEDQAGRDVRRPEDGRFSYHTHFPGMVPG